MRGPKPDPNKELVASHKDGVTTYSLAEKVNKDREEAGLNDDEDDKESLKKARERRKQRLAQQPQKMVGPQRGRGMHWVDPKDQQAEEDERVAERDEAAAAGRAGSTAVSRRASTATS